jgi:hypothetical protein
MDNLGKRVVVALTKLGIDFTPLKMGQEKCTLCGVAEPDIKIGDMFCHIECFLTFQARQN